MIAVGLKRGQRQAIRRLKPDGWVWDGQERDSHSAIVLRHPSGARLPIDSSPGDPRWYRNLESKARRRIADAEKRRD